MNFAREPRLGPEISSRACRWVSPRSCKCSPYEAMFVVPMKLGIANSVLPRNLTISMTNEEDLEKVININNECTGDIEDEDTDHEQTLDLELQGNGNTSETETYVTMEVETEVQNEKNRPRSIL